MVPLSFRGRVLDEGPETSCAGHTGKTKRRSRFHCRCFLVCGLDLRGCAVWEMKVKCCSVFSVAPKPHFRGVNHYAVDSVQESPSACQCVSFQGTRQPLP